MLSVRIQSGYIEPLQVLAVAKTGAPLTGLTDLYIRLRRESDGYFLDWSDWTFKANGHVTLNKLLTEIDATNLGGVYEVTGGFVSGNLTNPVADDTYVVYPLQTPGTSAVLPGPGEIKVDQWAGEILDTKTQVSKLDSLATLTPAGAVTGSLLDRLCNKDSSKTYNQEEDSLEGLRDRIG